MPNHPNRNWRARLRKDAQALGPDLVSAWVGIFTSLGEPLQAACDPLNEALGKSYGPNLLLRWRRGEETTPRLVQRVMRKGILQYLMNDDATGEALSVLLEPPK